MLTGLKKYLSNFIIAIIALQVLNLGLYAQDFETVAIANGPEQNIINSVTEYIAEVALNKVNAFPEKKETSTPGSQNSHEILFKFQPFKILLCGLQERRYALVKASANYNGFLLSHYASHSEDIIVPPPKP